MAVFLLVQKENRAGWPGFSWRRAEMRLHHRATQVDLEGTSSLIVAGQLACPVSGQPKNRYPKSEDEGNTCIKSVQLRGQDKSRLLHDEIYVTLSFGMVCMYVVNGVTAGSRR